MPAHLGWNSAQCQRTWAAEARGHGIVVIREHDVLCLLLFAGCRPGAVLPEVEQAGIVYAPRLAAAGPGLARRRLGARHAPSIVADIAERGVGLHPILIFKSAGALSASPNGPHHAY